MVELTHTTLDFSPSGSQLGAQDYECRALIS
jgi:hypothetical protein